MSTTLTPFEKFMRTDHARLTEREFLLAAAVAMTSVSLAESAIWRAASWTGYKLPLWREEILERKYGERLGDAAVDAWRCIDREVVA